jgi:hypothetical protein
MVTGTRSNKRFFTFVQHLLLLLLLLLDLHNLLLLLLLQLVTTENESKLSVKGQRNHDKHFSPSHVPLPVLLLTRIITVWRVPAAMELRLFATICAPLFFLRLLHGSDAFQLALLSYFVDQPAAFVFQTFAHFTDDQVGVVLEGGHLLSMGMFELFNVGFEQSDSGLGMAIVGQVGQGVFDDGAEEVGHLGKKWGRN